MILAEHSVGCPLKLGWMNSNIRDKGVTLVREPRVTNPSRLCQWTQSPSQFCYLCLVRLVIHGSPKCVTGRPMWRRMEPNEGPHLDPPDLTRWHTLCPHVSLSSHTHTYQHKHHTHRKFLLVPLFPPPLHIHTQGNLSPWRHIRLSL